MVRAWCVQIVVEMGVVVPLLVGEVTPVAPGVLGGGGGTVFSVMLTLDWF